MGELIRFPDTIAPHRPLQPDEVGIVVVLPVIRIRRTEAALVPQSRCVEAPPSYPPAIRYEVNTPGALRASATPAASMHMKARPRSAKAKKSSLRSVAAQSLWDIDKAVQLATRAEEIVAKRSDNSSDAIGELRMLHDVLMTARAKLRSALS